MNSRIRIGVLYDSDIVISTIIKNLRKHLPEADVIFEWNASKNITRDVLVSKLKSGRVDVLIASSKLFDVWDNMHEIKKEPLLNTQMILLVEEKMSDALSELSHWADAVVFADEEILILCAKIRMLCDEKFFAKRNNMTDMLFVLAEDILTETFFLRVSAGSIYIKTAMLMCAYNSEYYQCLSALCFAVQHEAGATSKTTVEKCIRTDIHRAYDRYLNCENVGFAIDNMLCEKLYGQGRPTMGKALPILTDELIKRYERKCGRL